MPVPVPPVPVPLVPVLPGSGSSPVPNVSSSGSGNSVSCPGSPGSVQEGSGSRFPVRFASFLFISSDSMLW